MSSPLDVSTGRHVRFSRLDWLRVCTRLKWEHCWKPALRYTAWRWYLMLRARLVRTARPDGTAAAPAAVAVPLQPGACLPAINPKVLARMRADDVAAPVATTAGWALAPLPSWARDGACPYPADTLTDMPAIPAVRPYLDDGTRRLL